MEGVPNQTVTSIYQTDRIFVFSMIYVQSLPHFPANRFFDGKNGFFGFSVSILFSRIVVLNQRIKIFRVDLMVQSVGCLLFDSYVKIHSIQLLLICD